MEDFQKIRDFVIRVRWGYDFVLTRNTTLRKDLKLWGDDAVEFIEAYAKEFCVDVSEFDAKKYFPPEGDTILPAIIRALQLRKSQEYIPLTLGDLEEGIKKGKLV